MADLATLEALARLIRRHIMVSTTAAGSGHPTSSLSATELMTALMFSGHFRADLENPEHPNNDRLIFSKGHASPLFYALYAAAGKVSEEELLTLRKLGSRLEGHPTMRFPYTEAATGSLGQGLSVGVGMAINAKFIDKLPYNTFVLLGDSEMAEGSQWEAIQLAAHYKLDNLVGMIDVNRLGQRGETMYGHDIAAYAERVGSFGWKTIQVEDGHDMEAVLAAYEEALQSDCPAMIIARTMKGKGVSLLENQDDWHGKAVDQDQLAVALTEIGEVDLTLVGKVTAPEDLRPTTPAPAEPAALAYEAGKDIATRKAYGKSLARLFANHPEIVVLDAEVSNSTFANEFQKEYPDRFFEMFIAEQNMVGVGLGLARRGKHPFVSSFAAFLTRAYDQIRMCQYSEPQITFVGSHAGVSIGEDGSSQMGLEDLAMFRTLHGSVVLYPSDVIAMEKLVEAVLEFKGVSYIRTTRGDTPILYAPEEQFRIGGSKVLRHGKLDSITVVAAGITLHEALAAYEILLNEGITIRVIDLYSIKPIDELTLRQAAQETAAILTVEDHYPEGGLGEAVMHALADQPTPVYSLPVATLPQSGKPQELLESEQIDRTAIVRRVKELVRQS